MSAKPVHLACPDCWSLIPPPLQELVYRLFREARGSDDHIASVRRCYEAIRAARNGEPVCRVCGCTDACCQACIQRISAEKRKGIVAGLRELSRSALETAALVEAAGGNGSEIDDEE